MKSSDRRRKFIINPEVQYGLIKYLIIFTVVVCLAQIIPTMLFFDQIALISGADGGNSDSASLIYQFKRLLLFYQLIPTISISLIGFFFFNRFTNRIVGPIFTIQRTIQQINDGAPKSAEIHLRGNDYFQDLAHDINLLIKKGDGARK